MEITTEKTGFERYAAYKDSGVEWLGELPEHWEIKRIKDVCKLFNGDSIKDDKKSDYEFVEGEGYPYISTKDIDFDFSTIDYENGLRIPIKNNFKTSLKGSTLLCIEGGSAGQKIGFLKEDVCFVNKLASFEPQKGVNGKFLFYYLKSKVFQRQFNESLTGLIGGVAISSIRGFIFAVPLFSEQTAIANFLDRKIELTDRAIAQKEKQIELLKERRQVLINKAVTRGLNPNVPLKDSGVEWIGEIPEHWKMEKIKFHFRLTGGGTPSKERKDYWDGDIPWVSPKDMKSDVIHTTEDYMTLKGLLNSTSNKLKKETLLMVVRSGILQRKIPVAIAGVDLTINQDIKAFIPTGKVLAKFLFHYIKGSDNFLRNDWVKQGATVESVEINLLINSLMPILNKDEQEKIILHIENFAQRIDTIISCKQAEIEKLKEYKATLINSAVTGKIKVS